MENEASSGARQALVLNDRAVLSDLIRLTLNHGLFEVHAAATFDEVQALLSRWHPDIAVVDLENDDSEAVLDRLGVSKTFTPSRTPVLGLTRRGDLRSRLRAFDQGVDDVLTTPFSPDELLARCVVIARRATGIDHPIIPVIRMGEMQIDIMNREVRAGTSVIHLTGLEEALLYLLASRSGRITTREEILDAVWGPDFIAESNIVDRHIRSLRIKLQNDYRHPRFIATVPGKGYRFIPTFSNDGWVGGATEPPARHRAAPHAAK